MQHYLLIIWNDIESAVEGPFENDEARLARAREIREESDEHGVYRLNSPGEPTVEDFSGGEINPN